MGDRKWIIIFLAVLLALISFPFAYMQATGEAGHGPNPALPKKGECIKSKEWMRANHQQLLNHWRCLVFRKDKRTYTASNGEKYRINLMTCFNCHSKKKFCDRCHNYVGVKPYCWNCHTVPKGK